MSPRAHHTSDRTESKLTTPAAKTARPKGDSLHALVRNLTKLHYPTIDDAATSYLQRMANKLHSHSRVPLCSSTVKQWQETLHTGTILYGVDSLAPTLLDDLSKLVHHLETESATSRTGSPHVEINIANLAKGLVRRIALLLAVNSFVRDLLPQVVHWECFDPRFSGDKSGQTVYFNALIAVLAKHQQLLDRLEKVSLAGKVKVAFDAASRVASATKGGQAHDKARTALARMQIDLKNTIDIYQEHYFNYLSKAKNSRGTRPFRNDIPEDMRSMSSRSSDAGSREWWPRSARDYRRYIGRSGSASSSETAFHPTTRRFSNASSNGSSDADGQRAAFFQTSAPPSLLAQDFPPPLSSLPPPPHRQPSPALHGFLPPPPPLPEAPSIETWRQTVADNAPLTGPPVPPMEGNPPPPDVHPPMVHPAPPLPPPPRPALPVRGRSASSSSDSSGGHWDSSMRTWGPPPPPEYEICWHEPPQALRSVYKQLQAKDAAFRKAQAAYAGIVRKRDAVLKKAHAFDELPRACCELLLFLHNNFDLHKKAKKPESATKLVLR